MCVSAADSFKALDTGKEKTKEDDEFQQQRKANIAEVLQAKEDGKVKTFGSSTKAVSDKLS